MQCQHMASQFKNTRVLPSAFGGNNSVRSTLFEKGPVLVDGLGKKQCAWICSVKTITFNISPAGKEICIAKQLCASVCVSVNELPCH